MNSKERVIKLIKYSGKNIFSAREVSEIIGVSYKTIIRACNKEKIKSERIGRCYSIQKKQILKYFNTLSQETLL